MKFATLRHLETFAKEFLAIQANQKVSLCKYVPHKFEWEHFDPNRDVSSGKGKKKNLQKAHQIDLKNFPFLLKDGDIIGVRVESENADHSDDFQTEHDLIAKSEFEVR